MSSDNSLTLFRPIFVFRSAAVEELFQFDYWQFSQRDLPIPPLIRSGVPDIAVIRAWWAVKFNFTKI